MTTAAPSAAMTPAAGTKGLATPGAGVMFTPRVGETPRVAKGGEMGYSANGSPINLLDTVKARGKRARGGESSSAAATAQVALTLADGSEMDLSDAEVLKKLDGDDETRALAVAQLQQIQDQVAAHLKALKAPHVPEI